MSYTVLQVKYTTPYTFCLSTNDEKIGLRFIALNYCYAPDIGEIQNTYIVFKKNK